MKISRRFSGVSSRRRTCVSFGAALCLLSLGAHADAPTEDVRDFNLTLFNGVMQAVEENTIRPKRFAAMRATIEEKRDQIEDGMSARDASNAVLSDLSPHSVYLTKREEQEQKALDARTIPVESWCLDGGIGYIDINTFFLKSVQDKFRHAVSVLDCENAEHTLATPPKAYILDLRDNPGGLLDMAADIAGDMLPRSVRIFSQRGRKPENVEDYEAGGEDILQGKPLVVLIDAGTTSAAEVVAAALQDHKRATVIGWRSFGKGTIQTQYPIDVRPRSDPAPAKNFSAQGLHVQGFLYLTNGYWLRPNGGSVQAVGVIPDIEVGSREAGWQRMAKREADYPNALPNPVSAGKDSYTPYRRPVCEPGWHMVEGLYDHDFKKMDGRLDGPVACAANFLSKRSAGIAALPRPTTAKP